MSLILLPTHHLFLYWWELAGSRTTTARTKRAVRHLKALPTLLKLLATGLSSEDTVHKVASCGDSRRTLKRRKLKVYPMRATFFVMSFLLLDCPSFSYQPAISKRSTKRHHAFAFSTSTRDPIHFSRRDWVATGIASLTTALPLDSLALAANPYPKDPADLVASIRQASRALQKLLDNWEESVIDCNYADVPRDLLGADNKEQLLEKASTFALFDKSVSVDTCRTNNKKIRDYLGRTGIGPVVGLDKILRQALDLIVDPDDLDAFVQATEAVQQALSRADSYSYTAGGDYDALNNFDKEEQNKVLENNVNLKQVRQSIQTAIDNLNTILRILTKDD